MLLTFRDRNEAVLYKLYQISQGQIRPSLIRLHQPKFWWENFGANIFEMVITVSNITINVSKIIRLLKFTIL